MTVPQFYIKKGDRAPSLRATLTDGNDDPIDLTDAVAVLFLMGEISSAAVVVSPATSGVVRYDWGDGDTEEAGIFTAEFEIDWGDEVKQTVPSRSYIRVHVEEDVDEAP